MGISIGAQSLFCEEQAVISIDEDVQHDERKNPGHIDPQHFRKQHAFARIGFSDEVIPAPAIAARTKCKINEAA